MPDKWIVDADFPQGHLVPMTPEEEMQLAADQAAAAAAVQVTAARRANADKMRLDLHDRLQEMRDLAGRVEDGTATAADQRRALVLCLRGTVRLALLNLVELDAAA